MGRLAQVGRLGRTERSRGNEPIGERHARLAIAGVIDQHAIGGDRLTLQAVKEAGQPIEVVLRPFLERMMVALRTSTRTPRNAWLNVRAATSGVSSVR